MRDGIPLRVVVIGSVVAAVVMVVGTVAYFSWMRGRVLQDAPLVGRTVISRPRVVPSPPLPAFAPGEDYALDVGQAATLLVPGALADLAFDAPFARLRLSQPEGDRWLNADLIVQPYVAGGHLALKVLSGKVGDVSVSSVAGEWARGKIERVLAHQLASRNLPPLAEAKVEESGLHLRFAPKVQ
ncbi:MAG TPA: hypothetical protein VHF22_12425 [Planctomycetota bacterium]|nr:hypothetical protein [Planctomycetota bacterium]